MAGLRTGCKYEKFERHFFHPPPSILPRLLRRKPQALMQSHTEICEAITEVEYIIMKDFWEGLMQWLICEAGGQICLLFCHWSSSGAAWGYLSVTRYCGSLTFPVDLHWGHRKLWGTKLHKKMRWINMRATISVKKLRQGLQVLLAWVRKV